MSVEIIVPFRAGCGHRERAWSWVRSRFQVEGWGVVEAPAPDGPWCKGAAVNPAVEESTADIIVVVDADVWTSGLERAVYAVAAGLADWAAPHDTVHRLDEVGTRVFMEGGTPTTLAERTEKGAAVWGGGVLVGRRETLLEVPFDEGFVGWGHEDQAIAVALRCLYGEGWRGDADLIHLWHPPQERLARHKGSHASWTRYLRYRKARHDPEAMRALLEEGRCLSPA